MLLRLAYLGGTNALAMLRMLPIRDHDKNVEILVLRHQITVLERQLGRQKPRLRLRTRGGSSSYVEHRHAVSINL